VLDGLVAWWKMDEASWNGTAGEVVDSSGSNNGVSVGGADTALGLINRAGNFGGSSYLNMGNTTTETNNFTISFWIKKGSFTDKVCLSHGAFGNSGWYIQDVNLPNAIKFHIRYSSGDAEFSSDANIMIVNQWNFVCISYSTPSTVLYVNNIGKSFVTSEGPTATAKNFNIGRYTDGGFNITGLIDDVRIYNRALSSNEVNTIYQKFKP
jgi:hypothetical protein